MTIRETTDLVQTKTFSLNAYQDVCLAPGGPRPFDRKYYNKGDNWMNSLEQMNNNPKFEFKKENGSGSGN